MRPRIALAALAAFTLALVPATLGAPGQTCWTTSEHEASVATLDERYYLEVEAAGQDVWIYQEANGIEGLQRQDREVDDVADCRGEVEPDERVF